MTQTTKPLQPGVASAKESSMARERQGPRARFCSTDLLGTEIDKWRLERVLGEGGMSVVYEASHQWLKQSAAVKLLLPMFYNDDVILQRFQQEALTLSQVKHPNVIEINDFGVDPDVGYYMVLALLEGQDLHGVIERFAPIPLRWLLPVMQQLCRGVEAVHRAGILHRDVKPSNVFLSPAESTPHVRLLDFGIAKVQISKAQKRLTSTGTIVGTPAYLAPEQVLPRRDVTSATDIYAMGVILFELLTGRLPLDGESSIEHVFMVANEIAPLLGTMRPAFAGTPLESLLARTLAKEAEARPASAMALWRALESACEGLEDPRNKSKFMPSLATRSPESHHAESERPETPERIEYGVQGTNVFSITQDIRDGLAPQAYLETLDAVSEDESVSSADDTPAAEAPIDTEDAIDAELRKLPTGDPALTPGSTPLPSELTDDPTSTGTKKHGFAWGIWLCFVATLGAMAWGGWYWWPGTSTAPLVRVLPQKKRAQTPRTKAVAPVLSVDALVKQGSRAFAKGQLARALGLWRRAVDARGWSSHPQVLSHTRVLSSGYARQLYLPSAIALWVRFLASPHPKAALAEARQQLTKLRAKATLRQAQITPLRGQLARHMQTRQWLLAMIKFKQLRRLAPGGPALDLWLAQKLAAAFPAMAGQLARQVATLLIATPRESAQAKTLARACAIQVAQARLNLQTALARVSAALAQPKRAPEALKLLQTQLQSTQILLQPYGHTVLQAWLKEQWRQRPTRAMPLWEVYQSAILRAHQDDRWIWLKYQRPTAPTKDALSQQATSLRLYTAAHRDLAAAEGALGEADLPAALRGFRGFLRRWKVLQGKGQAKGLWGLRKAHNTQAVRAAQWAEKLATMVLLERKLAKALKRGQQAKAAVWQRELLSMLGRHPAREVYQRRFAARASYHRRRLALLAQGHRAYRGKLWGQARALYLRYQKAYPRASKSAGIKRRLKACRCAMKLFAFEICKPSEFPAHHRPRR